MRHLNVFVRAVAIFGLAAACHLGAPSCGAQTILFADVLNPNDPDGNSIRSVNLDGTNLHTVVATGDGVRGLDVDPATGFMYWTDVDNFVIRRARLDGSNQVDLVTSGLAFPSALRLDLAAGKMYWGDQTNEGVFRSNLDGSDVEAPVGTEFFRGLALDHVNSRIYWSTSDTASSGRVLNSALDGSDQHVAVPTGGSNFKPGSIALDIANGKIYWTDAIARRVRRRPDLNGSNTEDLFSATFVGSPKGITLDLAAGRVYWGQEVEDFDSGGLLYGEIRTMGLDGGDPQIIISGLGSVNDLVLVPAIICAPDFNHSGSVDVQDIFDFLNAWFASDPNADFNHADGITVQDIFDFLAAWFTGC